MYVRNQYCQILRREARKMSGSKVRAVLGDILEDLAGDVIKLTGCQNHWGEIELPECLRNIDSQKETK